MEYCDEILHTHWYWQDVPHTIVKWHLRLAEFFPRFKFWIKWDYCKMTFIIGRGFVRECIQLGKFSDNYLNVHRCTIRISWHSKKSISGAHFCSALFWCRIYASCSLSIQRNLKTFFYAAHGRGVYICGRLFGIPAHAELFGLLHLLTLFLEEFDYTASIQQVLHTTGYNWVEVVLDNISLSRLEFSINILMNGHCSKDIVTSIVYTYNHGKYFCINILFV